MPERDLGHRLRHRGPLQLCGLMREPRAAGKEGRPLGPAGLGAQLPRVSSRALVSSALSPLEGPPSAHRLAFFRLLLKCRLIGGTFPNHRNVKSLQGRQGSRGCIPGSPGSQASSRELGRELPWG